MNDLISVLLPVGKNRVFLPQALASFKKQSCKNFEVIIEDDEKDEGIAVVLMRAAKRAKGTFLARMDADDICEPKRFERQAEYLQTHLKTMVIGTWATLIDESGKNLGVQKTPVSWEEIKKTIFYKNPLIHPSWMMRRVWFEKVGGYNASYRYSQDWELLLRTVFKYRIENIPEALLKLRIHRHSSSFSSNKKQLLYGMRAQIESLKRGDVPLVNSAVLVPKLVSLCIPSSIKYWYRKS